MMLAYMGCPFRRCRQAGALLLLGLSGCSLVDKGETNSGGKGGDAAGSGVAGTGGRDAGAGGEGGGAGGQGGGGEGGGAGGSSGAGGAGGNAGSGGSGGDSCGGLDLVAYGASCYPTRTPPGETLVVSSIYAKGDDGTGQRFRVLFSRDEAALDVICEVTLSTDETLAMCRTRDEVGGPVHIWVNPEGGDAGLRIDECNYENNHVEQGGCFPSPCPIGEFPCPAGMICEGEYCVPPGLEL